MKSFFLYLKKQQRILFFLIFAILFFGCVFYFYDLPLAALSYPTGVCLLVGLVLLCLGYFSERKKHDAYEDLMHLPPELLAELPAPHSMGEQQAQQLIQNVCRKYRELQNRNHRQMQDMIDYYSTWVHQIKTPIAAMRLKLQNEDSTFSRNLRRDLNRIENYVSMVLTYLRLDSDSTDFVIRQVDLDQVIRSVLRQFSGDFILKKLQLDYQPTGYVTLTDEKWLAFVIEQLLSNAVKYTEKGRISIEMTEAGKLKIKDTGIGIDSGDLPRIFEKGFTGFNGRQEHQSTGIGLYLCKRICDALGHAMAVQSALGEGTCVTLDLKTADLTIE